MAVGGAGGVGVGLWAAHLGELLEPLPLAPAPGLVIDHAGRHR
jgi:hypothetical protein